MEKTYYEKIYQSQIEAVANISDLTTGRANLSGEVAHFGEEIAKIEGFLRLLWGEAFNISGRKSAYFKDLCKGILNGVNPESKHFWGEIPDYGQLFVEMVALSVFLIETKEHFWDTIIYKEKENITSYMNQITEANITKNNWQFFKVIVQMAFYKLKSSHFSAESLSQFIEIVNSYYKDEGFYTDGDTNSKDYYISWAFHYYGLLYDRYMSEYDPKNCEIFVKRAQEYVGAYLAHFDNNGIAVPFGRSLAYRFAQGALLSMMALTKKVKIDTEILATLLYKHITYWHNSDMLKPDGTLSVGYTYASTLMAENYNSAGSPYWAFKYYAILGCDALDEVFNSNEKTLDDEKISFKTGNFISQRTPTQTLFYPVNNTATTTGYKDKYQKFVYSSKFAFSVSKGVAHLDEGAFDNTLAIKDSDTGLFLTKLQEETFEVTEEYVSFTWSPKTGINIKTTIIPNGDRHKRIHEISTAIPIEIFDIGFANDDLDATTRSQVTWCGNYEATVVTPYGKTGSVNLSGYDEVLVEKTYPMTHLLFKKAILTGLCAKIEAGDYTFESEHYSYYEAR